ncbi:MAG: DUF4385 domain-containing protein [Trueperaceae bacterium]|nr:DUF4385 domain-containing protein [Trueperaceae bacterium]
MAKQQDFYYDQAFNKINFREHPELYRIGKGEQGVLSVEPYKSELLPYWRFKTPEIASVSSQKLYELYQQYKQDRDFVGMDMARKFLQMGFTRSRRYANHRSGRKYSDETRAEPRPIGQIPAYKAERNREHYVKTRTKKVLPPDPDPQKARSAEIFYELYQKVLQDPVYLELKEQHLSTYEAKPDG